MDDVIYLTEEEKLDAICDDIAELHAKGQPVLVGTISIEKSERLSRMLIGTRRPPRGPQRQEPRARGAHHRRGRRARARSPSPPTWRAAAPTSSSAATPSSGRARRPARRPPRRMYRKALAEEYEKWQADYEEVKSLGRPPRAGHRAPRGAAHRQPAARPLGPPGRLRVLAVLHLPGGRPHAPLRRGEHQGPHVAHGDEEGRADRPSLAEQVHRARPEEGRGAQLRGPQAPARVRRRPQRAAEVHLPAPGRDHLRPAPQGTHHRHG